MKRDDVQKQIPGITKEQLDWLMGENGRDITAEKEKAQTLQTDLANANQQLRTAQEGLKAFEGVNVGELQGQIARLKADLAEQADSFAFDSVLDGAIRDAKGRDVKAIRGMLDLDKLKASKDRTADIKAAIEALAKEKAWAFGEDAAPAPAYPAVRDGGSPAGTPSGSPAEQFAAWFAQAT